MLRNAPPLEAIEIFVAAAHGDSLRSVARRLAISPSAVSRRIAALEAFLGRPLFDRNGQSLRLNAAGARYLEMVEPAIAAIQRASATLAQGDQQRLRVASSHSFAAAWLMPRLTDLQQRHGLEVEIVPTRDPDVLRSGEAQLAIWGGLAVPDDMIAETIADAHVVPVCAPVMADGRPAPTTNEDLMQHPLLGIRAPAGLWDRWFASFGRRGSAEPVVREFPTLQLMYEAAACGAGITLAMPLVAEPWLRSGKLVPCGAGILPLSETYRLYRPIRRIARNDVEQRFADWLHAEVEQSMVWFDRLTCAAQDRPEGG